MQVQLPKQDRATIKVAFQCGVTVGFVLRYYSDTNQYDLLIASDPDDEKTSYPMTSVGVVHLQGRKWDVFEDECYYRSGYEQWYDVLVYVAENTDSYDIRIRLYETRTHEE